MRVLVTGGAGFIGSNIVAALEERGDEVVVVDTFARPDQWKNLAKRKRIDMPASLQSGSVDAIVHMAAISSQAETDTAKVLSSNLALSKHYWDVAVTENIPFIYASSASVDGNGNGPLTPYAWSKLLFDQWAEREAAEGNAPPRWAGLRFTNVYGPNEFHKPDPSPICTWWKQGYSAVYKSQRRAGRDFVWVGDVVDVVLWALENARYGIFDVGSGVETDWEHLARYMDVPLDGGVPYRGAVPFPSDLLPRYQWRTRADLTALREAGYTKRFLTPYEGIRKYVTEYLATEDPYR